MEYLPLYKYLNSRFDPLFPFPASELHRVDVDGIGGG
jgi:hypothetical protein